ncbi:putative aarF domain-containing protein kinase 1 [Morella rubra]|uniref:Putative aarF domain-containing protein kinase 1 n=1 Tax=Morella rubra TaxID=262757 RepID=A0A6A1VX39_9ROSI|nr:putative aarF domain-containing protein kinase 1 [Morella rubra]
MVTLLDFKDIQEKVSTHFRPWQRSFQFWLRTVDIYTGYKVAQIVGKPDLAPAAWVRRLVTLCDRAPVTPFDDIRLVLEKELSRSVGEIFDRFDVEPLGSASIAQVHRARLRGDKSDVVVKVQHPGIQDLMMTDIHNLQAFALYMQKTDIKFDLFSITKEMEKQIGYEFDFVREANAMDKIRRFLYENNRKPPVLVPRPIRNLVSRRVLVMEFINGIPILNLGDEIAKRGVDPHGKIAEAAKKKILQSLTLAYGQMILTSGFFHADPHPGNILVGLLDYGQVKDLPENLRLGYANLVLAIADSDPKRASESYRELGIDTLSKCENEEHEMLKLAQTMFDTKLPPGVVMLQPFSEESSIKKIAVQAFPEELFSVLRTVHLLRGLSVGLGINYSCAEQWRPIAEEALYRAGRLKGAPSDLIGLIHRHIHLLEAALFLHSFSHAGWCLLRFVVFFSFSIWQNLNILPQLHVLSVSYA